MDWLCFIISPTYCRKGSDAVLEEMRRIFGKNLLDVRFVDEGDEWASEGGYCFLKCLDYEGHVPSLRSSLAVVGVLHSYETPEYLTDEEIASFYGHIVDDKRADRLYRGDIVVVTAGYLSGLVGIINGIVRLNVYRVVFKFYIRSFEERLSEDRLLFVDNLFRHIKRPVSRTSPGETGRFPVTGLSESDLELCARTRAHLSEVHW